MLNEDYKDMLQTLVDEKVRFLLVGAYALAAHGYPRSATVNIEGIEVHIPSVADLIINKRASGRTKDIANAEALENLERSDRDTPPSSLREAPHPTERTDRVFGKSAAQEQD